jgi:hypothetical protein
MYSFGHSYVLIVIPDHVGAPLVTLASPMNDSAFIESYMEKYSFDSVVLSKASGGEGTTEDGEGFDAFMDELSVPLLDNPPYKHSDRNNRNNRDNREVHLSPVLKHKEKKMRRKELFERARYSYPPLEAIRIPNSYIHICICITLGRPDLP